MILFFFFPKNNISIGTKQANQHGTITFLQPSHPALGRQSKSPSAWCQGPEPQPAAGSEEQALRRDGPSSAPTPARR